MTSTSDQWHAEGRRLQHLHQTEAAERAYLEALKTQPHRLDSRNNLAVLLRQCQRFEDAEELLRSSVRLAVQAWNASHCDRARLAVAMDWARLMNSESLVALEKGQHERCRSLATQQLLLDPNGCGNVNLGVALEALGHHAAAARSHFLGLQRHGVPKAPPSALVGLKLSTAAQSSQLHQELCNLATALLQIDPIKTENWHLLLARLGEPAQVWEDSNHPWTRLWKGQACSDLLIWDEQGFGDALQCLRWIPDAAARIEHLTLLLRPSLIRLVNERMSLPANCRIEPMPSTGPALGPKAVHCPIMGLPVALADGPQIPLPQTKQRHWLKRQPKRPGTRIGLVWEAGRKQTENAQRASTRRSLPATLLLEHALRWKRRFQVELVSLQLGHGQPWIHELVNQGQLVQLSDQGDWENTACCVEQLDLVVSVDTAIVHLAGNLGIPCLLLLNHVHDWRWGSDEAPLHWYPNQTILRCQQVNHWNQVLEQADSWIEALFNG